MILVSGANGKLGRAVLAHLGNAGHSAIGAVRATASDNAAGPPMVAVGELSATTDWRATLTGVDKVVHCAALVHLPDGSCDSRLQLFRAVNVHATVRLARQAAQAGVRRMVFISSLTVNGRTSGERPFFHDQEPDAQGVYARSKLEAETALMNVARDTGIEIVIIRPPRIIWPDLGGNLRSLAALIRRRIPLPFGLITENRRDNVSGRNLVDMIDACLQVPGIGGETFLASDRDPVSTCELMRRLGNYVGVAPLLLPVPPWAVRQLIAVMPSRLLGHLSRQGMQSEILGNLEIDLTHTTERLGWSPACKTLSIAGTRAQ